MKMVRSPNTTARAFSIAELMISIAIVAVLVALLLPMLSLARESANRTLCAASLKQLGVAWTLYLDETEQFPQHTLQPDWHYGGAEFVGPERRPILAADRPVNVYVADFDDRLDTTRHALQYRCPSDTGVFLRGGPVNRRRPSVLGEMTCFEFYGTSYRANPFLLDSTRAGIDTLHRPLKMHEIQVPASRLLLTGDAEWYYATRSPGDPEAIYEAGWHGTESVGNMLAVDGSTRFVRFAPQGRAEYLLYPRPVRPQY